MTRQKALVSKNDDHTIWVVVAFGIKSCLFTMPQHHLGSEESTCALAAQTLTTDESHLQLGTHSKKTEILVLVS